MVKLSKEEIAKHSTENDCWIIYKEKVYDVSNYLDDHPGGVEIVIDLAGQDCTEDYDDVGHSDEANGMLIDYYIGDVGGEKQDLKPEKQVKKKKATIISPPPAPKEEFDNTLLIYAGVGLAIAAFAFLRFRKA